VSRGDLRGVGVSMSALLALKIALCKGHVISRSARDHGRSRIARRSHRGDIARWSHCETGHLDDGRQALRGHVGRHVPAQSPRVVGLYSAPGAKGWTRAANATATRGGTSGGQQLRGAHTQHELTWHLHCSARGTRCASTLRAPSRRRGLRLQQGEQTSARAGGSLHQSAVESSCAERRHSTQAPGACRAPAQHASPGQ